MLKIYIKGFNKRRLIYITEVYITYIHVHIYSVGQKFGIIKIFNVFEIALFTHPDGIYFIKNKL